MKILAFSDLHRDIKAAHNIVKASAKADVVIGAGDFATCAIGAMETLDILNGCDAPLVVVHGNHDPLHDISGICRKMTTAHYLHGNSVSIGGIVFFGLGGEIPACNPAPWNVGETEDIAADMLNSCPMDAVLITHSPPYGSADKQKDGTHAGSVAIRDAVIRRKPKLHLCGHIHAAWGMTDRVGSSQIFNLGPRINWFDI